MTPLKLNLKNIFESIFSSVQSISGFSLIEVMITLGVMSIGMTAMISFQDQVNKNMSKQTNLNDFQSLTNSLYGVFSNETICKHTLKDTIYDPARLPLSVNGGIGVTAKNYVGSTTVNLETYTPGKQFGTIKLDSLTWIAPSTFLNQSTQLVDGQTMTLKTYQVTLQVTTLSTRPNLSASPYRRNLSFIVSVEDATKKIKSCFSTIDSGSVCSQLGGSMSGTRCDIPVKINESQMTAAVGAACTPVGSTVYRPEFGVLICNKSNKYELSVSKCATFGGQPVTSGSELICKFQGNTCPRGMEPNANWTSTRSFSKRAGWTGNVWACHLLPPYGQYGDPRHCNIVGHSFQNKAPETCDFGDVCLCGGVGYCNEQTITAEVYEIGCK